MIPRSLKLEELTWPEISDLIQDGWTRIIVPLGATEQHGPGLPQGVDSWHGEETALRAAAQLNQTLVSPVVPFGYSIEHQSFPGTISLRKETLTMLLEDISESLARSGFTFIYYWFGHGGDWAVAKDCLAALKNRWPGSIVTFTKEMERYIAETWDSYPLEEGIALEISGSHAGEFEASIIAALRPDLIRLDELEAGDPRPLTETGESMMRFGIESVSKNGVLGDQRHPDPFRGNRYLDCMANWLIQDFNLQYNENEK